VGAGGGPAPVDGQGRDRVAASIREPVARLTVPLPTSCAPGVPPGVRGSMQRARGRAGDGHEDEQPSEEQGT
jgi:hypothetical protein